MLAVPEALADAHLLALLARSRAGRVAAGELDARFLHHVAVYKRARVTLAYLRRRALARPASAHMACSMPQLVRGLGGKLGWEQTDDPFVARDRYHSALRSHLGVLVAAGLLVWTPGEDVAGAVVRTELLLLEAPAVTGEELAEAKRVLRAWRKRYGTKLNTGSSSGVRDVAATSRAPSCEERRGLGEARGRAVARARSAPVDAASFSSRCAPPCGALTDVRATAPTSRSIAGIHGKYAVPDLSSDVEWGADACGVNAGGAHTRGTSPAAAGTAEQTRSGADEGSLARAAIGAGAERRIEEAGRSGLGAQEAVADVLRRVAERQHAQAWRVAHISQQARQRTTELAEAPAGRAFPAGRVREAWLDAVLGEDERDRITLRGGGRLAAGDLERLDQAVRRWERNAHARPAGRPAGGRAAWLEQAAQEPTDYVAQSIENFRRLTLDVKAVAEAADPLRRDVQLAEARERREPGPNGGPLGTRRRGWPRWVRVDELGAPVLTRDGVAIADGQTAPSRSSSAYRQVCRDAHLLAGRTLPYELDGPAQRLARTSGQLEPDPYRGRLPHDVRMLLALTRLTRAQIQAMTEAERDELIEQRLEARRR